MAANLPAFDPALEEKVTFSVYGLWPPDAASSNKANSPEGSAALERAASLLHYAHGPSANDSRESAFHVLVASMAFYAAGHYSRAFVTIRPVEEQTPAARSLRLCSGRM